MNKINSNQNLKAVVEGGALLVALVGAFYLGQNVTKIEFADVASILGASQTASLIDATPKDPFAGYEYVLIDNSKGIHKVQTR